MIQFTENSLHYRYLYRSNELLATFYALSQLNPSNSLGTVGYSRERLSLHGGQKIEIIKKEIENLIPIIIENYKLVFMENFPSLTKYSLFFTNIDKLAIVEIINITSVSEFPALSYIVFPNIDKPASTKIVDSRYNHSITGKLRYQSLRSEREWGSVKSGYGYSEIDITLDGVRLYDPKAWVMKTRFSSHTPILDQVYSLISNDLKYLLNAGHMDWKDYSSSRLANDKYLQLAANSLINRQQ